MMPDLPADVSRAEGDFLAAEKLMDKWGLRSRYRPFRKNVVTLMGTISSGKSSFLNFFYGFTVQRVSAHQQDTHWTVVEVVDELSFKDAVGSGYRFTKLSRDQVKQGDGDLLRNNLYVHLGPNETVQRFEQFAQFADAFRRNRLVAAVLINGAHLSSLWGATEKANRRRQNTVMIDSPGLSAEDTITTMESNLQIFQYFFRLSHLTLFFVPADGINMVSSQLQLLELSIIHAFYDAGMVEKCIRECARSGSRGEVVAEYGGLSSMVGAAVQAVRRQVFGDGEAEKTTEQLMLKGTHYFDTVRFVLSKVDRIFPRVWSDRQGGVERLNFQAQWFELGCVFGRSFSVLRPPVFEQCRSVSLLPILQTSSSPSSPPPKAVYVPDLNNLLSEISHIDLYDSYKRRLEGSILRMCDDIQRAMSNSWWDTTGATHWDRQEVERLRAASRLRSL